MTDSLQATDEAAAAVAAVATTPRVTLADIEGRIDHEFYVTGSEATGVESLPERLHQSLGVLTICILAMKNGFMVLGKSAPASPENFDADLGRKFAREDCIRQVWQLEGYALRNQLAGV